MNIGDLYPSKYLKASDLKGREHELVMSHIDLETMNDGKPKPILYFSNARKGLALNKTNAEMIGLMFGHETDQWPGHKITIRPDKTTFGGEVKDCIRVVWKQHAPATPTPAAAYQANQERLAQAPVERRPGGMSDAAMDQPADDPLGDDSIPF